MNGTSAISCHSAPCLNDLNPVLALSVRSWETGENWTDQRQGIRQHFQSSFAAWSRGRKMGLLLTLGPLERLPRSQPIHPVAIWHHKGCRETWPRRVYSCLWGLNNKPTLILAELHISEDYLAYSSGSLRWWSIRNFQGWFIQLLLSKHRAPGSLLAHPL